MYSAYVGVNGTATSWTFASSGVRPPLWLLQRRQAVTTFVHASRPPRLIGVMWSRVSSRGSEMQPAVHAEIRVALEQRAVVQRRRVALAIALERVSVAARRDDRVDLDDAAGAGLRAVAAADPVQTAIRRQ